MGIAKYILSESFALFRIPTTVVYKIHDMVFSGSSEHVADVFKKWGIFRYLYFSIFDDCSRCKLIPLKDQIKCFTRHA